VILLAASTLLPIVDRSQLESHDLLVVLMAALDVSMVGVMAALA